MSVVPIDYLKIIPLGDSALIIRLGDDIAPEIHRLVVAVAYRLEVASIPGIIDIVPTFASVTIHYDPLAFTSDSPFEHLRERILPLLDHLDDRPAPAGRLIELPVSYGGEFGPDLPEVAAYAGMSEAAVIALHSSTIYLTCMIGFLPGFPYLGGLPERLAMPRRDSPRLHVPAGSVGIGGAQTGIYPLDSPGGWQVIGRTPTALFLPQNDPPTLLQPGDRVRFRTISPDEFDDLERKNLKDSL